MNNQREGRHGGGSGRRHRHRRPSHQQQRSQQQPKPQGARHDAPEPAPQAPRPPRKYAVVIYETFEAARKDKEALEQKAKECDQLNIVIKEEGKMDDPELMPYGKVFAGAAWSTIHERRVADGWYEVPH